MNNNSININEEEKLSNFNFESIITIEEILTYFFNNKIKLTKNNFINYYKIINYYLITEKINDIFRDKVKYSKNIEILFNLQFITILIEGFFLFNSKNTNQGIINTINDCLFKNHQNFLLLTKILLNELQLKSMTNIYSNKISKIILEKIKDKGYINTNDNNDIFLKIEKNNKEIENQLKLIINSNKIMNPLKKELSPLSTLLDKLQHKSSNYIIDYCLKLLDVPENTINEIKNRTYLSIQDEEYSQPIYHSVKVPFLPPLKKGDNYILTIILDLDETLITFEKEEKEENEEYEENDEEYEEDEENENKKMIIRPGLYNFLDNLINLKCELIIFTSSNKNYADKIIDEIEKNKKYFKKRLYRENCVLIGSAYVKDISKLGRDLSKVIIIDNDLACFYLQQENGILIRPFVGNKNEENDKVLENLYYVLMNIIKKPFNDIRIELEKYKNEIKNKINNLNI